VISEHSSKILKLSKLELTHKDKQILTLTTEAEMFKLSYSQNILNLSYDIIITGMCLCIKLR